MSLLKPDQTFYATPRDAMQAPRETHAYVALPAPLGSGRPDGMGVIDLDPDSPTYATLLHRVDMPSSGDELHHFGWNACSASLCPSAPHPHVDRRYLVVPGLRSSRITILDTKPDPLHPRVHKVIEADELRQRAGYSRPHTVHCGPDALYVSALGGAANGDGPGGIFRIDHNTFEVMGAWEKDRGPQHLAYDFWWHINKDILMSSEWGTPAMVEDGLLPELLLGKKYGRAIHLWDLRRRTHLQRLEAGPDDQMVLELRPAHNPDREYGFVGVVTNVGDLSSSIWLWDKHNGQYRLNRVIKLEANTADPADLPPLLQGFGAVPPLVTDINLSLDDRFLYVSCWGTGELRQYDVSDPYLPRLTGTVSLGGIGPASTPHPSGRPLPGGSQMIEVSRDGKRIYVTNSLYLAWDEQFYPGGVTGWMAKVDAKTGLGGGLSIDREFLIEFGEDRAHQVRLGGGDSSSDTFCYA